MKKRVINIFVGIIVFLISYIFLPKDVFTNEQSIALGLLLLMTYLWITRPVHIAVVSFLPIIINSIFGVVDMNFVISSYFSPVVILLLGANILTILWTLCGLDKRIALKSLMILGTSVKAQLIVWFVLSVVLSSFLPNAVVTASLIPIAVSMIVYCSEKDGADNNSIQNWILLAIVWGAGLGGFGTPMGGAMNLVAISHIETFTGTEFLYVDWVRAVFPWLLLTSSIVCLYFAFTKQKKKYLSGSREYFRQEYSKMNKISKVEIISILLFLTAIILVFARPLYKDVFPEFKAPYAFMLMAIIAFFLTGKDGEPILKWETAVKKINWSLMMLFGGGLAMGNVLVKSGTTESIANLITTLDGLSINILLFMLILFGMFLSNASSNTAACAVIIPVAISAFSAYDINVVQYVIISAVACNCAYILPTSVRSIPISYGLNPQLMLNKGLIVNVITLIVLAVVSIIFI